MIFAAAVARMPAYYLRSPWRADSLVDLAGFCGARAGQNHRRPILRSIPARFAALLLVLVALATPALADWPAGGKRVSIVEDSFNGVRRVRFLETPAGDLYVQSVGCGGNANGYMLQRIGAGGDLASGWPEIGFSMGQVGKGSAADLMGFTVDDSACVWRAQFGLTTSQTTPQAQMVRPDAVALPTGIGHAAWNVNAPGANGYGMGVAPATGGSYLAFGAKLQRMTRSGAIAAGWPANGVSGVNSHAPALQPDGAGGVVVFGASMIGSPPTARRVDATGTLHAGWPAAGLALAAGPDDFSADIQIPNFLIPSGPGSFIAGWVTPFTSSLIEHVQLQRFSLAGVLDPAWPANGITVSPSDTLAGVTLLADGLGGVHALWYAHERPMGTHLRADGTFVPGLTAAGVDLAASDPAFAVPRFFSNNVPIPNVVADTATGGGLVFAWDDFHPNSPGSTPTYHVRWLNADYTPNPSEPSAGRLVVPAERGRSVRALHADGIGGVYLAWEASPPDTLDPNQDCEVWMTRLLPSSLVNAPPVHAPVKLALSAPRPNPARGVVAFDVTLPDDSPARIELLDIAGRVLRSQLVQGTGAHAVSFADLAWLAPGLYFARATTRMAATSARVVVSR